MRSEDKKADVGATGNRDAQKALDRIQSRTARGPYSHLLGEWCVFVDD